MRVQRPIVPAFDAHRWHTAGCARPLENRRALIDYFQETAMELSLAGRVALVTGASKGIGLACATLFAEAGARVVFVARDATRLGEVTGALAARGLSVQGMTADLSNAEQASALARRVEAEVGPVDILVNSAGAARRNAPDELSAAAFHQGMDAKYFSTMHLLEPVIRAMGIRGRGAVVNIIGQGGRVASPMHIAGGAANSALMLATVGYARAYASKGVRVNGINPGLTRTGRVEEGLAVSARASGRSRDDILADELARIPMGRMGEPEEVANVALFLASDAASYVSGAIIPMDGCTASVI
jgi:NAD(P)-dependent dehydrogenase (short-subunit alcohol dehydrogenase family)